MTEETPTQVRIAQLEHTVQQLRERLAALEAVQPHMATKAELIESSAAPRFGARGHKRKKAENSYWINDDVNFLIALIGVAILTVLLAPTAVRLLAALFTRL